MSAVFPLVLTYCESVFPVTGLFATLFVVGSAAGEMLTPLIVSTWSGTVPGLDGAPPTLVPGAIGPVLMLYLVGLGCCVNAGLIFVVYGVAGKLAPPATPVVGVETGVVGLSNG